jgi:hypothetical protein
VLPPSTPMSPSFGMSSQQIMGKYHSEDLDVSPNGSPVDVVCPQPQAPRDPCGIHVLFSWSWR